MCGYEQSLLNITIQKNLWIQDVSDSFILCIQFRCLIRGGHLEIVDSKEEQQFLKIAANTCGNEGMHVIYIVYEGVNRGGGGGYCLPPQCLPPSISLNYFFSHPRLPPPRLPAPILAVRPLCI